MRNWCAMIGAVLVVSGLVALGYGSWRGSMAARSALLPLVGGGDPTRTLIDTARPIHARVRVRTAARSIVVAVAWLAIAMYGLYLATVGLAVPR
jgi:hypothetical protein